MWPWSIHQGVEISVADTAMLHVLSGVFYMQDGDLWVADEQDGARLVNEVLGAAEDEEVHVVVHHHPPDPPLRDQPGGGCCYHKGHCPFGHHEYPDRLYEIHGSGTVSLTDTGFQVTREVNGEYVATLVEYGFLVGHRAQIVVTALPEVEQLKDDMKETMENPTIEGLQARMTQLRDLLSHLQNEAKKQGVPISRAVCGRSSTRTHSSPSTS